MLLKVKSALIWTGIALLTIFWLPFVALFWLFERTKAKYWTGFLFRKLGHAYTFVNPAWKISIERDVKGINPRRPFIVVCNHQSHADVPLISRLPWDMKWVAKSDIFKVPFVGWMMRMAQDIPVYRKSKNKKAMTIQNAQEAISGRSSVMFFPEGTRSKDGRVLRFTDGAFIVAIKNQIPILPLVIDGSSNCLPKNDWVFKNISHVRLKVLQPIETTGMTMDDLAEIRDRVRRIIIHQLAEWRNVDPSEVDTLTGNTLA